ncbi:MAG TPA: aspartate dehydrogenase domain-containing protein [Acidimicrobiales bacterium]|nr:aspartate dehydrogenase domain-containing protein [Acidimicrobiales bacterium]
MTAAVGVIGAGAIGSVVAEALARGEVPGCRLAGVLRRSGPTVVAAGLDLLVASIGELVDRSDVVVEAAGAQALADHGPAVVDAGVDLLVVSVGALVDDRLRAHLCDTHEGRGRVLLSSGAIGGLDLLRAAALMGPVHSVRLTTVKRPQALERPWMSDDERAQLLRSRHPHTVFSGSARDAVRRFPDSSNVAATLALATTGFDATHVDIVAEAEAARVRHRIEVEADAGRYELTVENTPSANPRTSAVTPYAVLRALADRDARLIVGA